MSNTDIFWATAHLAIWDMLEAKTLKVYQIAEAIDELYRLSKATGKVPEWLIN